MKLWKERKMFTKASQEIILRPEFKDVGADINMVIQDGHDPKEHYIVPITSEEAREIAKELISYADVVDGE